MLSELCLTIIGLIEGFNMPAYRKFVRESQYWNTDQILSYQNGKLRDLVNHAYEHVPYYRNLFDTMHLAPSDIQTVDDLKKLPVLHKSDILADPDSFIADNAEKYKPVHHHTGGTTGVPFQYINDRKSWALNWALKMRQFEWAGYRYGHDRLGVMAGGSLNPHKGMSLSHRFWRRVNNYYSMPITTMDEPTMDRYYEEMKRQKIKFLRGYPSAIATFARHLINRGLQLPLQSVFTTAEMLYPFQRELIRAAFGCETFDAYGCGDGMGQAVECSQHDGLHICHECSILQIVGADGTPVGNLEEGEVVLTSLMDYAMPLLRYAPGDRAVSAEKTCPCGRSMPMIAKIIGRTSDVFRLSNGRTINGLSIPFEELTNVIDRFQIVQESENRVVLNLESRSPLSGERISSFKKMMEVYCGEGIDVDVKVLDKIEVPASDKFRYVISKVK